MNWRTWLKPVIMILYIIIICIALPFIVKEFQNKQASSRKEAWFVGGVFVIGAVPISLWTILEHVVNYTKPYLQRHIIRILWMVPIYALNAWFSLGFPKEAIYFDTLRECYEAYVIYNFMAFLLNFLRREYPDLGYLVEQKQPVKHLCPFCCCPAWPMGRPFISRCRHGVLQYTLVRPLTTLVAFICEMAGVYHVNEFRFDGAFLYLNIVNNISQVWAMYSLIMFYRCTKAELQPLKPVSKFVCVKFVVFLSFWQSVLFAILTWTKVIAKVEAWKLYKPEEISSIFQNFFVCIEMFLAAIAHHFSFSVGPYRAHQGTEPRCCISCLAMCDVSDVQRDMVEHVKHVGQTVRSKLQPGDGSRRHMQHSEQTPLMDNRDGASGSTTSLTGLDSPPVANHARPKAVRFDRVQSVDSIGSGSSLVQHHQHQLLQTNHGSDTSLNNHLLTSHSSALTVLPEDESGSFHSPVTFHTNSPPTRPHHAPEI